MRLEIEGSDLCGDIFHRIMKTFSIAITAQCHLSYKTPTPLLCTQN